MASESNKPGFTATMSKVFKGGQSLSSFNAELKQLTPTDKAWFHDRLNKEGFPCEMPGVVPVTK